jgi:hypothetical protein
MDAVVFNLEHPVPTLLSVAILLSQGSAARQMGGVEIWAGIVNA